MSAPLQLGMLATGLSAQLAPPTRLRLASGGIPPNADSPIARNLFPRTFLTPAILATLRAQIGQNAKFRARWQTAVTQFESTEGTWATSPKDPYSNAFAALLAAIRRPGNDLGLSWRSSWQTYRDRIVTSAYGWRRDGTYPPHAIGLALVYDSLFLDLTPDERADISSWVANAAARDKWVTSTHAWDNGETDDHLATLLSSLVLGDGASRFPRAYEETTAWADSVNWMGYAIGTGYEWHGGYPSRTGTALSLYMLKNAGGLTEAETTDRMSVHLRDAWQLTRQFVIPHPAVPFDPGTVWINDRVHVADPDLIVHRGLNVGSHMVWALALLPGNVQLAGLAKDEASYFGYLQHVWNELTPQTSKRRLRNVVDFTFVDAKDSTPTRCGMYGLFCFPAWLVLNAREYPEMTPEAAGIPTVRRWWPGTLEWTTIRSDFAHTTASLISYHHRKWFMTSYEEGTRQNGSWHVHRAGPLLVQRGSEGHGAVGRKATWGANGTVSFVDHSLYPEFTRPNQDDDDAGNVRFAGNARRTKAAILAEGAKSVVDYGDVTAWHGDAQVVAISSDLTRSYNSSLVQYGKLNTNERKIASFTREFVCVQRNGDGTDHERVFTYDRIRLLDTKFEPRYNLCPATEPDIDGAVTAHEPWAPSNGEWTATGPTRWDFEGATRLIYDNTKEPKAARPGNGKVCVTWLQPNKVRVQKLGGTNAVHPTEPRRSGYPGIGPWNGWHSESDWASVSSLDKRAYVGLYTVSVIPAPVTLDTRFLVACDVMAASDQPDVAQGLTCDSNSVAARCGASAVVFAKDSAGHRSGSVSIPAGISLVVLANLPPGEARQLAGSGGLTITTSNRTASAGGTTADAPNRYGRLIIGVTGGGTLTFS